MLLGVGFHFTDPLDRTHRVESASGHSGTTASSVSLRPQYSMSNTFTSALTP